MKKNLLLILLLAPGFLFAQTEQEINSLAQQFLDGKPGALIIGVRKNGQNKIYYYGETKKDNKELPGNNSLFEIGELTEIFTTTLFADFVHKGIVGDDDPLQKHLPKGVTAPQYTKIICEPVDKDLHFERNSDKAIHFTPYICRPDPAVVTQPMRLCYLANHTSGLPEKPDNATRNADPFLNYTANDLYQFLKGYEIINKQEYAYQHSFTGMGLLAHILELKSGKDYDALLEEHISKPAGLMSTFIYKPEDDRKLLQGYNRKGIAVNHQHYGVLAGAKGLCSNITDMMRMLEISMYSEKSHLAELIAYNQKPRIKSSSKNVSAGWMQKKHGKIIFQNGITNGFAAYMGILKDHSTGVVILSSLGKDVHETGEKILELQKK